MIEFEVDLGDVSSSYPVTIGTEFLSDIDCLVGKVDAVASVYMIVDEYIYNRYGLDSLDVNKNLIVYVVKGMKNNKTFLSAMKIFQDLDDNNISRDATIVAIGGGVIGDLAGFIASCWYRGVNLVHIPTTLLSAVDSCVGGKTAINFRNTVNAIGSYHHPVKILIDSAVLWDLPKRELASGFGEIVKYGMISGGEIYAVLKNSTGFEDVNLERLIELSLRDKERYVRGDVRESANRLFLNFGHTIGHAVEFSTIFEGEESLRHGEGVALGMVAVIKIAIEKGFLKEHHLVLIKDLLRKYGLPCSFDSNRISVDKDMLITKIVELAFKDKKRTKSHLRLILLKDIGEPFIYTTGDQELIRRGVEEIIT